MYFFLRFLQVWTFESVLSKLRVKIQRIDEDTALRMKRVLVRFNVQGRAKIGRRVTRVRLIVKRNQITLTLRCWVRENDFYLRCFLFFGNLN